MKKRLLAFLLAAVMVIGMVACGDNDSDDGNTPVDTEENNTPAPSNSDDGNDAEVEPAAKYWDVDAGAVEMSLGAAGGGEVSHDGYAGIAGKDYTDPAVYTYRDYTAGTTDMKWDPMNWETNEDSNIVGFVTDEFYYFVPNSTLDGYAIVLGMAADYPEDVTGDYVGSYGIVAGDTAKAFKIRLREDLVWEDGTPINADTYMYSYQEMLNPLMLNRRADSLYAGTAAIYGAREYLYAGQHGYAENMISENYADEEYVAVADMEVDADGYFLVDGKDIAINLGDGGNWGDPLAVYYQAGYAELFVKDGVDLYVEVLSPAADDNNYVRVNQEIYEALSHIIAALHGYESADAYAADAGEYAYLEWEEFCYYGEDFAAMDFSGVGIVKTGEYELVYIYTNPIENPDYNVPYNGLGYYLVYEPLWESCKTYFNANGDRVSADSADVASITTTYGTSVDTTKSFGAYKLTYFELDKAYTLERNDAWFGYHDGNHSGWYQADIYTVQVIEEHATALMAFLNGEIDGVSLLSEDMTDYGTSDYILYTPESYTTKLTFNTDPDSLAERGTEILGNVNFRHAFALAIDRTTFATSYTAAGSAGYGLLNYMYQSNPLTGEIYRESEGGKRALTDLYGLTYGADGDFDSLDEAYEAITGYDLAQAQELMKLAYAQCVADGSYDGTSNVEITLNVYNSDDIYVQMFNYLNDALQSAIAGSGFEGKVALAMKVDADYYNTMYSGGTDMIFTTWGGAASSPYTLLYECYADASDGSGNQMEYGFDTSQIPVTVEVNGESYTTDLQSWARWMDGDLSISISNGNSTLDAFASYDTDSRSEIFGRMEYTYLSYYATTPIYYRNVASLYSQKAHYPTNTYLGTEAGFGGFSFMVFDYSDDEWAGVVSAGLSY